ncbi:hypothetical protein BaRGS_00015439 [Batillaria attramentaria]|uniref:Uncharacterized protein n=1 Tax=Batillaria attramentaria TaxID=370345 RepID=A0ABD0L1A3_9CAEN
MCRQNMHHRPCRRRTGCEWPLPCGPVPVCEPLPCDLSPSSDGKRAIQAQDISAVTGVEKFSPLGTCHNGSGCSAVGVASLSQ